MAEEDYEPDFLVPDPEEPRWLQEGVVVFDGVVSQDDIDRIREEVAAEAERLKRLLADNHTRLVELGIAQKVLDIERAEIVAEEGPENCSEENLAPYGLGISDIDPLEILGERMEAGFLRVDGSTQFRVGENLWTDEPCDPSLPGGVLYVTVFNRPDDPELDSRSHMVGSRIYGEGTGAETAIAEIPEIPVGLRLTEKEVAIVASLVDNIKGEWLDGRLPHLGASGRYDTLVVEASATAA